jgi:hypothetical protein
MPAVALRKRKSKTRTTRRPSQFQAGGTLGVGSPQCTRIGFRQICTTALAALVSSADGSAAQVNQKSPNYQRFPVWFCARLAFSALACRAMFEGPPA